MEYSANYVADLESKEHRVYDLSFLLGQLAQQYNIEPERALAGSGIEVAQLFDTQAVVSFGQKLQVLKQVQALSPEPDFALKAGQNVRFKDFGFLGYAVMSSATLFDALRLGIEFLNLSGPVFKKRMGLEGKVGYFAGEVGVDIEAILPFCTEFWLSSIQSLCAEVFSTPLQNISLSLPYPKPRYFQSYQRVFDCSVNFDANEVNWRFDASKMRRSGQIPNPVNAQQYNSQYVSQELLKSQSGLEAIVSQILLECSYIYPKVEQLAEQLQMQTQDLEQQLAAQGSSYQQLLDHTRQRVALQYLSTTDINLEEIAKRLGFDKLSEFEVAFNAWTGNTAYGYR